MNELLAFPSPRLATVTEFFYLVLSFMHVCVADVALCTHRLFSQGVKTIYYDDTHSRAHSQKPAVALVVKHVSTGPCDAGATKRVPKRVTETVAICKVTVSWATYWLSDITRYDVIRVHLSPRTARAGATTTTRFGLQIPTFSLENTRLDLGCCTFSFAILPSNHPFVSHTTSSTLLNSSKDGKLGGGVTYELQYRSRVGQDWILVPTKTPNKILTGLSPGQVYDFRVRAFNSAGWGEFSAIVELQMPSERRTGRDDQASEETD